MQAAISIDIGGTSTTIAIVSKQGGFIKSAELPMLHISNKSDYFQLIFQTISELSIHIDNSIDIIGIGIGAPSCDTKTGTIHGAANLPFDGEIDIVNMFNDKFHLPTYLIKDGNAAAIGEGRYGAAKGMKDFFVLTLGTGLGCGIVINNELVTGHSEQAGELGHAIVKYMGGECGCGANGCLETYVSATGIKRTFTKLLAYSKEDSPLRSVSFAELSPKMIYLAAREGDTIAKKAFEFTGELLGRKLAELAALINPEAIFISGGLANAGEVLFEPVIRHLHKNQLEFHRGNTKVLPSKLNSNEAALLGAASMVWQQSKLLKTCQHQ